MSEEKEELMKTTSLDEEVEQLILDSSIEPTVVEKLQIQLNKKYKDKVEQFKTDYHKYMQTGRHISSTRMREIKRRDLAVFLNLETDLCVIERVMNCDGVTLETQSYKYPVTLTKTILIKLFPLLNVKNKIILHLCIANVESLEIANHTKNLVSSVFLKHLLKHEDDRKLMEKPFMQIIVAGLVFGIVGYFMFIQVFKKVVVTIIGELTLNPHEA